MAGAQSPALVERDIDQAFAALKKGSYLLKYGRRGKPKFYPFRLSSDESALIWRYGKDEKHLELRRVSRIIPGQRTPVFQRYPRPEKEYLSFSLICEDRSIDLICKDRDEAEIWFTGLKALIGHGNLKKPRNEAREGRPSSCSPCRRRVTPSCPFDQKEHPSSCSSRGKRVTPSCPFNQGDIQRTENNCENRLGKAFADLVSVTSMVSHPRMAFSAPHLPSSELAWGLDNSNAKISGAETCRGNFPSPLSSPSRCSSDDDLDLVGNVSIWGEGICDRAMGGTPVRVDTSPDTKTNAFSSKVLESTTMIDAHYIACGERHIVVASKQGGVFSWGKEAGGRLGHGGEADVSHPKLIEALSGKSIKMVACGNHHSCAVTLSGDLYTWGDNSLNCGVLGHGSDVSHWIPQRVSGSIAGLHVSFISCGPWHTALVTSSGQLFTFGDGAFGALGHGDRSICSIPRKVEALKGLHTVYVACGIWHTVAVVDVTHGVDSEEPKQGVSGTLFTWGDGVKGQLGHSDYKSRLVPESIASLIEVDFSRVACGDDLTAALTTSGHVYTMGSPVHGQLGSSTEDVNIPVCVRNNIGDRCVKEIACGSHHVAVLTSKSDVYTWGKGANGQLGHGDYDDRNTPTLVTSLKDKQVKGIACGSNFTAIICLCKGISRDDDSMCASCHNPFSFIRPRHNCYNCGSLFCNACSTRKSVKAALAPSMDKPYRVCDDCFFKLQRSIDPLSVLRFPCIKRVESEKEKVVPCLQGFISRLSSIDTLMSDRNFTLNLKFDSKDNRMFPLQNGNIRRPSSSAKSPTNQLRVWQNLLPSSALDYKSISRASSPGRGRSPQRSRTPPPTSDLSLEVRILKAQVEKLVAKCRCLEAELERKSKALQKANAQAAAEVENYKAVKEGMESLRAQLREMAEKVPLQQVSNGYSNINVKTTHGCNNPPSNASNTTSAASPNSEPGNNASTPSPMMKDQAHKSEWIVQHEPGVFVTMASLLNGVNELRRVRFSRKRFTEVEAKKWWAENEAKVRDHYNVIVAA